MKTSVKNIFFALGATAVLASCGENAWNDHLDGFEGGANYNTPVEGAFTMSSADYNAVASNATNKELAGEALSKALKAVGSNGMFSAQIPAKEYLPAYLASSSAPYFKAPVGSKINITYDETGETEPIIADIADAKTYTVSKEDYIKVWGSDEDYINAFAPENAAAAKLPNILKEAYPDAAEGSYALVSYNESATNPVFITSGDVEKFEGGVFYLVADGVNGAAPVAANKGYGYLSQSDASVADGKVTTDALNAFMFIPTDGGFYIMDAYGRYLSQTTYNSFNVSANIPETGAVWSVEIDANGEATITNTTANKWIQFDGQYKSYGSYDSAKGSLPVLYKAGSAQFYLVTEEGHGAGPIAADKSYGYLASVDMTVANGIVATDEANAFTFEMTAGGYYIKDSYGRYLYMKGTFNSFNLSTDVPEAGGLWTLAADASGAVKVVNAEMGKTVQFDSNYSSWGAYADITNALPKLYNAAAKANASSKPAKIVASTPVTAAMTAVYTYDGSKWAEADNVVALDAADYAAMGFSNNKLDKPEVYIPLYLKANKPYAVEGDEIAVVYNGTACAFAIYDGQNWTVNNNEFQTRTAQFENTADGWVFKKYVGISYFNLATELVLDTQYLMVAEGICATPLATSKTYGYLNPETVVITDGVISQKTEVNAFTFASTVTADDKTYKLPEGLFVIIDSNGRYLYMTGSFDSFNVSDTPMIKDGAINAGYTWKAEKTGEGTWTITNGENSKWIQYSTSYSSFGSYGTEKGVLPALYVLSAE